MNRLIAAILLVALSPLLVGAEESWVGQRIFFKRDARVEAVHQNPGPEAAQEFDIAKADLPLRVIAVEGELLRIAPGRVAKSGALLTDQALEYYNDYLRQNPADPVAWNIRGMVWHEKGQFDRAIDDFTEAIRLDPNNVLAHHHRGMIWTEKADYPKAIEDYTQAIFLDPADVTHRTERGRAWLLSRQWDKSIKDLNEAIRLDPNYLPARFMRGDLMGLTRQYDKSIEDFTEAIRIAPTMARGYVFRGASLQDKGENDKAIEDLSEGIRLGSKDYPESYQFRGNAWQEKGEFDKAIADYTEAIRLIPKGPGAYYYLARLRATCRDERYRNGAEAVGSATKACELTDWKNANALETLAASYAEAADFPAAIQWAEKAIQMSGNEATKQRCRDRLELYKAGKPFHEQAKP